ncbi:MAG: hypothetical protein ACYC0C_15095 [Devosia sp.]
MKPLLFAPLLAALTTPVLAQEIPTEIGQCVRTTIAEIASRLEGAPDSGDAVLYANGVYGVSYEVVTGLRMSRAGDPIELCLTALPQDCPPGDERGKIYSATNLKNDESWELPDAQHMCSGA